jgi:hypothetical protein
MELNLLNCASKKWATGDNSKNFFARLCPEFLEIIPADCVKVNVTAIINLKPEDKERLNPYALGYLNEWQERILNRVPGLRQLSEEQVAKDLATYLDENEMVEFQKCLADIRRWLSMCMGTQARFNSHAIWVITPMFRVEQLVAKAYEAKEYEKKWNIAYNVVNPPDRDAKTYLTEEEYKGFVKAAVQAIRACIERGEDYLGDERSLDYRRYLAGIRARKEKEKVLFIAKLAAEEFNRQLNGEKMRLRALLSPNRKGLEGYFRKQVKDRRYSGQDFSQVLSQKEKQDLDNILVGVSRGRAEELVPKDFRSFIGSECWRSFFLLPSADYILAEVPCLSLMFEVFAVVETGVWLKPGQKPFNGYVFDFPLGEKKDSSPVKTREFLGYHHFLLTPEELKGFSFWQDIPLVLIRGLLSGEKRPSGTIIISASNDEMVYKVEGFEEEVEIPIQFAEYLEHIGSIDGMVDMGIMGKKVGTIVQTALAELEAKRKTPPATEKAGRRDSIKERAYQLFDEGKRPSDPEVKALGIKPKTAYRYHQEWKKARRSSQS